MLKSWRFSYEKDDTKPSDPSEVLGLLLPAEGRGYQLHSDRLPLVAIQNGQGGAR